MLQFQNQEEHLKQIITETRNGNISRPCFIKLMSWSGITAAATLSLLDFSTNANAAGLTIRRINPEMDRMLKELSVKVNAYSKKAASIANEDDKINDQGEENIFPD